MKPTLLLLACGLTFAGGQHPGPEPPDGHEIACAAYHDCGHDKGKGGYPPGPGPTNPTPEPGTFVMMGLAMAAGVGIAAWRRRG